MQVAGYVRCGLSSFLTIFEFSLSWTYVWYSRRYCMRGVAQAGGDYHGGGPSQRGQAIAAAGQDLVAGLRGLAVFPGQQARQ